MPRLSRCDNQRPHDVCVVNHMFAVQLTFTAYDGGFCNGTIVAELPYSFDCDGQGTRYSCSGGAVPAAAPGQSIERPTSDGTGPGLAAGA